MGRAASIFLTLSNYRLLTRLVSILAPGLSPQQLEPRQQRLSCSRLELGKEIQSVLTNSKITLSLAIVIAAASTALAKDGGLPKLNTEYGCHASEKALATATGKDIDTFRSCMDDENDARKQLEKDWAAYPASDKARCIQPKEYTPGYVEWLTCLEMERDVRALRKGQPEISSSVDKCPAVRYRLDGTVVSVDAC
jgi:hypothetical protein